MRRVMIHVRSQMAALGIWNQFSAIAGDVGLYRRFRCITRIKLSDRTIGEQHLYGSTALFEGCVEIGCVATTASKQTQSSDPIRRIIVTLEQQC